MMEIELILFEKDNIKIEWQSGDDKIEKTYFIKKPSSILMQIKSSLFVKTRFPFSFPIAFFFSLFISFIHTTSCMVFIIGTF